MIKLLAELFAAYVVIGVFLIFWCGTRWRRILDRMEAIEYALSTISPESEEATNESN